MERRWIRRFLAALLLALPTSLHSQSIQGVVLERSAQAPITGAIVLLLDEADTQLGGTLTDADGRFLLRVPVPGRYRVRAERIGYVSVASPLLEVGAGATVRHALHASAEAVTLEGITAQGRRRCVLRPQEGEATHRVWEEARKALRATALTRDQNLAFIETVRYRRELDPSSLRVQQETSHTRSGFSNSPFVSVPAEELAEHGFVRASPDEVHYYAPDAHVLLSDLFSDTHCLRVQPGEDGLIGLSFEPIRGRKVPEVQGVLWLDQKTAELQHLTYRYVNLPFKIHTEHAAGRVEFDRLDNGAWIVSRWHIRMPLVGAEVAAGQRTPGSVAPPTRLSVIGIHEDGGEVLRASATAGEMRAADRAVLVGTVFDSTRTAPLADATVFLSGTQYTAQTDDQGQFRMEDLPDGEYSVSFLHPRLDSLEWIPRPDPVTLRRGEEASAHLVVPSTTAIWASACADSTQRGVVVGLVRNADEGVPIPGARVVVRGQERREVRTDAQGRYRVCDLPAGASVVVQAHSAEHAGEPTTLQIAGTEPVRHDMNVRVLQAMARAGRGSNADRTLGVTQPPVVVTGVLADSETGDPIRDASVRLLEANTTRSTDARGRFRFAEVPYGIYTLEVQHLQYGTHRERVTLGGGGELKMTLRLTPQAIAIAGVEVTARAERDPLARRSGVRRELLVREQLQTIELSARDISDVVRGRLRGIYVREYRDKSGHRQICMESSRQTLEQCNPIAVVIDLLPMSIEDAVSLPLGSVESVEFVRAIEASGVYPVPPGRDVLVIFTRGNGPHASRD
jgi:hypothetical protein